MNGDMILLVRLAAGPDVPESARVTHIVRVDHVAPAVLVPYCGIVLKKGKVDPPLDDVQGAPCEPCFRVAPIPGIESQSHEVTTVSTAPAPATSPALPKREPGRHLREALEELEEIAVQAITAGDSPALARVAAHNLELLH